MAGKSSKVIDTSGVLVEANVQLVDYLIIAPILIPIIFGAILLMMRRSDEWTKSGVNLSAYVACFGIALMTLASFALLLRVNAQGPITMTMGRWLPPFGISFSVDKLGALLTFVGSLVALMGAIYSTADAKVIDRRFGFYPFLLLMMAGVSGAFLTGDIFNLYVWFEVLLISSFGLIVLGSEKKQLDGTMKYAFLNLVATTMFLIATGYLYGLLGTLNMADIAMKLQNYDGDGPVRTIAVLYIAAFSMKAAAFPLNFWLPASYHTPRIVVSALFGGLLTKVGIYSLLRVAVMLFSFEREFLSIGIAWLAGATMLVGVLGALAQNDIRRILGYLVISGIGTMLAGIYVATLPGLSGVIVYTVHSMLTMTALYLVVGMIGKISGSFDLREVGGLYAVSPMLSAVFFVLCLAIAGLPLTSGFWGKFILVKATLEIEGAQWLALIILVSGLLTTIAIFRVWIFAFWRGGPIDTPDGKENYQNNILDDQYKLTASLVIGVLTGAILLIGFMPEWLLSYSADAAQSLLFPNDYIESVFGKEAL